jgi:hypothetical protein
VTRVHPECPDDAEMKQYKTLTLDVERHKEETRRVRTLRWVGHVSGPLAVEMASNLEMLFPDPTTSSTMSIKPRRGGKGVGKQKVETTPDGTIPAPEGKTAKATKTKTFNSATAYCGAWTATCAQWCSVLDDTILKISTPAFDWASAFLLKLKDIRGHFADVHATLSQKSLEASKLEPPKDDKGKPMGLTDEPACVIEIVAKLHAEINAG